MNENKIEIRNLSKAFGKKVVLDGIDLDVKRGESLVVIGGSGTGKSVLIKCIQGLLNADSGSIKVDEEEVVGAPRKQVEVMHTKMGMLFQGGALFDSLSVWQNVAFGLIENQNMPKKQAKNEAIRVLRQVGLAPDVAVCRRRNFPAVCRSASVWPVPLPPNRKSSFSMNRPPGLTRLCLTSSMI